MSWAKLKIRRKSPEQIEKMAASGRILAEVFLAVREMVRPGVTTGELDQVIHDYTIEHGHRPACLGYPGEKQPFPKSCCTSVNDVICHGIPGDYVLQEGDVALVSEAGMPGLADPGYELIAAALERGGERPRGGLRPRRLRERAA